MFHSFLKSCMLIKNGILMTRKKHMLSHPFPAKLQRIP